MTEVSRIVRMDSKWVEAARPRAIKHGASHPGAPDRLGLGPHLAAEAIRRGVDKRIRSVALVEKRTDREVKPEPRREVHFDHQCVSSPSCR